jgi:hypothetical protein
VRILTMTVTKMLIKMEVAALKGIKELINRILIRLRQLVEDIHSLKMMLIKKRITMKKMRRNSTMMKGIMQIMMKMKRMKKAINMKIILKVLPLLQLDKEIIKQQVTALQVSHNLIIKGIIMMAMQVGSKLILLDKENKVNEEEEIDNKINSMLIQLDKVL